MPPPSRRKAYNVHQPLKCNHKEENTEPEVQQQNIHVQVKPVTLVEAKQAPRGTKDLLACQDL